MNMMKSLAKQSYQIHSETLSSLGVNYLRPFPELDEYRVEAADGLFTGGLHYGEHGMAPYG